MRAGAEEFLPDGQNGLRDRALGTDLTLPRIMFGYLTGHLLFSVHLVALSLPIMLLAFHVSGAQWPAFSLCLLMILCQAMFYRLTAAAIYIAIGQHSALTAISIRSLVVAVYVLSALAIPFTSHLVPTFKVARWWLFRTRYDHAKLSFSAVYGDI